MTKAPFALLIAVSLATPAVAAPARCEQRADAHGDATGQAVTGDDAMDLLSGDIASNGRLTTVVFRLAHLDPEIRVPASYRATITGGGRAPKTIAAVISPLGSDYGPGGTGVYDSAKNEVRVHVTWALGPVPRSSKVTVTFEAQRGYGGVFRTFDTYVLRFC